MKDWNELSMKERAAFIKVGVSNGLINIDDIQKSYREYAQGGSLSDILEKPFSYQQIPQVRFANGGDIVAEKPKRKFNAFDLLNLGIVNDIKYLSDLHKYNKANRQLASQATPEELAEVNQMKSSPSPYYNSGYWGLTNFQRAAMGLPNSYNKFTAMQTTDNKESYLNIIEDRYRALYPVMKSKNFSEEEIDRLMPFLLSQTALEAGWRLTNPGSEEKGGKNNFGGMRDGKTGRFIDFDSPSDFYNAYINNLDKRWGDAVMGEQKGWRSAKSIKEYADILNREDLNLKTLDEYNAYMKSHPNTPAYLYTPDWENNNTTLYSKLNGVYPRASGLYNLLKQRIDAYNMNNSK